MPPELKNPSPSAPKGDAPNGNEFSNLFSSALWEGDGSEFRHLFSSALWKDDAPNRNEPKNRFLSAPKDDGPNRNDRDNQDRLPVLIGRAASFIPQWDKQISLPGQTKRPESEASRDNPPPLLNPSELQFHYCHLCGLTWLVGEAGGDAARSHPSHHTSFTVEHGTSRSVVVFVAGMAFKSSLDDNQFPKRATGAYFGPSSPYNLRSGASDACPYKMSTHCATMAASSALRKVRLEVLRRRDEHVLNAATIKAAAIGIAASEMSSVDVIQTALREARRLRLIIATDSRLLVDAMCRWIHTWTYDESFNSYRNSKGVLIANSGVLRELLHEVEDLAKVGVQVMWYQIRREFNTEAIQLANGTDCIHETGGQ